jgi:16S rRNA (cytidine1402-2'-O)-methyltransferase
VKGRIFLIPVTLGSEDYQRVIPERVLDITRRLRYFIVEDLRSARRYLRLIDKTFPIDDTTFYELNEHTGNADITFYLDPAEKGNDIGLMSEAGLPCIADPGSRIIEIAHKHRIPVTPLAGPSSILLALISSGLNGQNFTFNGYLPVKPNEKSAKLRELEKQAIQGYAQIFMEAPYRNQKMLEAILATCRDDTRLCIATDISLESESIKTMKISEWKKEKICIDNKLVVFILQ